MGSVGGQVWCVVYALKGTLRITTGSVVLFFLLGLLVNPALAEQWVYEKEQQLVYKYRAFDGIGYTGGFVPQSESTIYLLAHSDNLLSASETLLYFWPLKQRWRPEWESLDQPLQGKLQIMQGGKVLRTFEKEVNVQYYPDREEERVFLYTNQEALDAYRDYQRANNEYARRRRDYLEAHYKYEKETKAFLERVSRGDVPYGSEEIRQMMPERPTLPEPPVFFVTAPSEDYIVNLPVGEYQVRIQAADGTILKESEKALLIFDARRKGGIGYEMVTGDKWNQPVVCQDAGELIYTYGENVLYLRPILQNEYDDLFYSKLLDPQATGNPGQYRWVYVQPVTKAFLTLTGHQGEVVRRVERALYVVQQTPDKKPGYRIIEQDEGLSAGKSTSFEGYRLDVTPGMRGKSYTIKLARKEGEEYVPGSDRQLRVVELSFVLFLYALSFLPVAVWVMVCLLRRASGTRRSS